MKTKQGELTRGEQQYLEHVREAKSRKLTLAQYCEQEGLRVQRLYNLGHQLKRKACSLPNTRRVAPVVKASRFMAVQVQRASSERGISSAYRLRHPSGWVMECEQLPPAGWFDALVKGGCDVAA